MRWKDNGGGDFEKVPTGTHVGRCIALIDLGTTDSKFGAKRDVLIRWELPHEKQSNGEVFTIGQFYNQSLNEKSNLRAMLKSWRGRDFTEAELAGFDPRKILGQPCMVGVIEKKGDGGDVKHVVGSVSAMPKGMEVPAQVNASLYLSLERDEFNAAVFDSLSDKTKERIKTTPEWAALQVAPAPATSADPNEITDQDIPF